MQLSQSKEEILIMDDSQNQFLKVKQIFLDIEIQRLHEYLGIVQTSLDELADEIEKRMEQYKDVIEFNNKNQEIIPRSRSMEGEVLEVRDHENLLRKSFLVSLYSFMELWLLRECRTQLKLREEIKISLSDLRGNGLEKAKTCFSKVLKNEYAFGTSEDWQFVTQLKAIRNCIVHRQGSLSGLSDLPLTSEMKTLQKFVENEEHLHFYSTGKQIFVEYDFCIKSLLIVKRFMMNLIFPKDWLETHQPRPPA